MDLRGKRIAVLVADQYQEMEVWYPLLRFREDGAETEAIGAEAGKTYNSKKGYPVVADRSIGDVHASDYDAVVIPGGWAPDTLRQDPRVLKFVREMHDSKRWWRRSAMRVGSWHPPISCAGARLLASRLSRMISSTQAQTMWIARLPWMVILSPRACPPICQLSAGKLARRWLPSPPLARRARRKRGMTSAKSLSPLQGRRPKLSSQVTPAKGGFYKRALRSQ